MTAAGPAADLGAAMDRLRAAVDGYWGNTDLSDAAAALAAAAVTAGDAFARLDPAMPQVGIAERAAAVIIRDLLNTRFGRRWPGGDVVQWLCDWMVRHDVDPNGPAASRPGALDWEVAERDAKAILDGAGLAGHAARVRAGYVAEQVVTAVTIAPGGRAGQVYDALRDGLARLARIEIDSPADGDLREVVRAYRNRRPQ